MVKLRIVLILASLVTLVFITRRVRDSKVRIEDSLFWFCAAGLLFLLSLFPQIFYVFSDLLGIQSPSNFVFLVFIFLLMVESFNLSMRSSKTDTKVKNLTQNLAIEKFERWQAKQDGDEH